MAEQLETTVDRLMDLVEKENGIDVGRAAKGLGISNAQVERIAAMLEQSGLIKLHYGMTGTRLLPVKSAQTSKAAEDSDKRATIQKIAFQVEREMRGSMEIMRFTEDELLTRLRNVEEALEKLDYSNPTSEQVEVLKRELRFVEDKLGEFKGEFRKLESRQQDFENRVTKIRENLQTYVSRQKKPGILSSLFSGLSESKKKAKTPTTPNQARVKTPRKAPLKPVPQPVPRKPKAVKPRKAKRKAAAREKVKHKAARRKTRKASRRTRAKRKATRRRKKR